MPPIFKIALCQFNLKVKQLPPGPVSSAYFCSQAAIELQKEWHSMGCFTGLMNP
jgi:hypothetical protein